MLTLQFVFNVAAEVAFVPFATSGRSCTFIEQALYGHVNIEVNAT